MVYSKIENVKAKMRVLFLNPPDLKREKFMKEIGRCGRRAVAGELWPQTGLAYLTAVVKDAGFTPALIDAMAENLSLNDLLAQIKKFKPQAVVANTSTPTFKNDVTVLAEIKKVHPAITILVGTHCSALPQESVSHPAVDFVIINEAEDTIVELLDYLNKKDDSDTESLRRIKGIAFNDTNTGEFIITEPRPYIEPLDRLPFPAREFLPNDRYHMPFFGRHPFATVIPTRGCPWQCIFCRAGKVWGRKIRVRSPENVIAEIEQIIKDIGIRHIVFMTDSLTLNKKWLMEFLDRILTRNLRFQWICNSRVDAVDLEMLRLMRRAGCKLISYGVESGNQQILDRAKKAIRLEDSLRAIQLTRKAGILSMAYFILGLPGENNQTIQDTLTFMKRINPDYINVHIATPFPGTEFYDIAKQNNWLVSTDWADYEEEGSAVVRTEELSAEELIAAQRRAMREFYIRPRWVIREIFRLRNHSPISARIRAGLNVIRTLFKSR
ncbi:radical SAM protein [Candidatus Sumerlaeota bacterium]|nr:radical SAM protein [Candidatus Sumerlaeota bacterium]